MNTHWKDGLLFAVVGSIVVQCSAGDTQTYIAHAVADSSIYSNPMSMNQNYGSENTLVVGESDGEWWSLIDWDFVGPNKVPVGSKIVSVAVDLYQNPTGLTSPIFMEANFIKSGWTENGVTFFSQPQHNAFGVYPIQDGNFPSYIRLLDNGGQMRSWVDGIVNKGNPSHGLLFKPDSAVLGNYQLFRSREDTPPRLVIEYESASQFPDIAIVNVEVPQAQVGLCEEYFDCMVTFENIGGGISPTGTILLGLGLNTDDIFYPAGSFEIPSMGPGEARTVSYEAQINDAVNRQDYYIIALANVVGDQNDANDTESTDSTIDFFECPDIEVSAVATDQAIYDQGGIIQVDFTAKNLGSVSTEATDYRILLSDDPLPGNDDYEWVSLLLDPLDPFEERAVTQPVTLPDLGVPPGDYYIGVQVEDDGGFNDTAFTLSTIHINDFCLSADLQVLNVATDASAYSQGDSAMISFDADNEGCMASEPTDFVVVFSTDQVLDADDSYSSPLPMPVVDGMQSTTIEEAVTIPADLTPGEYYIAINISDDGSTNDTVFTMDTITVAECTADFTGDGDLTYFDLSAFLQLFNAADPKADFNNDGSINFFDISSFLQAFNAGCP